MTSADYVPDAEWLAQLLECGLLRGSFITCSMLMLRYLAPLVRDQSLAPAPS